MNSWNNLAAYFHKRHGVRVQKIPLDISTTCPNRDGSLSREGCVFCNAQGSGSGLLAKGLGLQEQWTHWHNHFSQNKRPCKYIAYFQSFSNTYGPPKTIFSFLQNIQLFKDIVGFSVGTRPDCLSKKHCEILSESDFLEKWVELGVQTLHDKTLHAINRGHTALCSEEAIIRASRSGLSVCAHVMLGLPGEGRTHFIETLKKLNNLPICGIKFHNTYIEKGTLLETMWRKGEFQLLSKEAYTDMMLEGLCLLRSDIVVHRVVADPVAADLCAPLWASTDKLAITRNINNLYKKRLGIVPRKRQRRRNFST